jgi:hypothetical protein
MLNSTTFARHKKIAKRREFDMAAKQLCAYLENPLNQRSIKQKTNAFKLH